jgi:hypothetical protein
VSMKAQMIKKCIAATFAAMAIGLPAFASSTNVYFNSGTITNPPVIEAETFETSGIFEAVISLDSTATLSI